MAISLTCPCGQQQFVAAELAGQTTACVACGKMLAVPAMGVLAATRPKLKRAAPPASPLPWILLSILAGGVLMIGAMSIVTWAIIQANQVEPTPIVQTKPEPAKPDPGAINQRPPPATPTKEEPPRVTPPPEKKAPAIDIDEPVTPPVAKKPLLEPIQPRAKDPPPEPAKPPEEKKRDRLIEPLKLAWKLQARDAFFQELIVTQKPTFKIQGIPIASLLQYQVVSRFEVEKIHEDGSLIVVQKVEAAKLLQADPTTRSIVEPLVAKLPGTTHTLHLSSKMDVTKFEGGVGGVNVGKLKLDADFGFQMASLLDRDGWKELAQATFFQMDEPLKPNQRWAKPMTHHWGPLGAWIGKTHYVYLGEQNKLHKVGYGLHLSYQAPKGGMLAGMQILDAKFVPQQAEGVLLFDAVLGRVVAAEERFRVKGVIQANLLGQNTRIEIDEDQHFLIRIHEKWGK